jgi:hypothetical protein
MWMQNTGRIREGFAWCWNVHDRGPCWDDEHRRDDDEIQHEVILTRGFWLAETACTQALWAAVTGENPSHFKGTRRPVENVSRDDLQGFIGRLNEDPAEFESMRRGPRDRQQPKNDVDGPTSSIGPKVWPARFRLPPEAE